VQVALGRGRGGPRRPSSAHQDTFSRFLAWLGYYSARQTNLERVRQVSTKSAEKGNVRFYYELDDTDYKEKIPSETRTILEALAEPTRQALVMMLAEKSEVSFRELAHSVQPMNPSTLNHHLRALMKAGLVENRYRKIEGNQDYSFYGLTELGKEFLNRIGVL